ncbi:hypothetical protein N431DRAFT_456702 [Stipitochalara longipes BDJ]|nr:hypothetical protein N431DRAFT_456702 [Stipitochalara longipes BDJ]
MSGTSNKKLPLGVVTYLINHVFLPPKLPQEDDVNFEYESTMLDVTIDCLSKFKGHMGDHSSSIDAAVAMIANLKNARDPHLISGAVNEKKFRDVLGNLCSQGGSIPLHLQAQNCGVLISKEGSYIHFEAFELSPLNEAVITTKGRLRRSFPGPAFSVDQKIFEQASFLDTVAQTLAKMSHQAAPGTTPQVKKAGRMHDENRDTTHPKLVTELFMAFIRSVGEPIQVSRIWKNTREEVLWDDSGSPWRRSSLWLLVRVILQLLFSRSRVHLKEPIDLYKMFMVYFMSLILDISQQHSIPCDLIHAMNAKLVRRLFKVDSIVEEPGLSSIAEVMRTANERLRTRWSNIMEEDCQFCDLPRLKNLNFGHDVGLDIPALDEYIKSMRQRMINKVSLPFQCAAALGKHAANKLPTWLASSTTDYTIFNLKAIEAWVASNLSSWLELYKNESNTCGKLADLIRKYHGFAHEIYKANPEAMSTMLLTILELWIACDSSATHICEFLTEYDPGVPGDFLESLVLPLKSQMERLLRAEQYLMSRKAGAAKYPAPHIFQDFGKGDSFSVRYFNQSFVHQTLLNHIERQANAIREKKRAEFVEKEEQYRNLMQQHDEAECEYVEVVTDQINDFREQRHKAGCKKCSYKNDAATLGIHIHEWPLPSDIQEARSTVFELDVPPFFSHWRDTTVFLVLDVLQNGYRSRQTARFRYQFVNYWGLKPFCSTRSSAQRIGLLSSVKPHSVTHRREKKICTATESDVCLDNGLVFRYYDGTSDCFVNGINMADTISKACTYSLPHRSSSLQPFLSRTAANANGPSPNTVIASQAKCPSHMSLDEFKALGAIPLGYRLQWQNILLQLAVPAVDFKVAETGLVILQSIYQAGPSNSEKFLRAGHDILNDENFACSLLAALNDALERIKENWESSLALSTFISLASRLLSLTASQSVEEKSLAYLSDVRHVALGWINLLKGKIQSAVNETQRTDLSSKAVEIALICFDSFNLDEQYLEVTLSDSKLVSILIQCSMLIQEGELEISRTSNAMVPMLHQRWKGTAYRCYPFLSKKVLENGAIFLDDAIKKSWCAYEPGHGWQPVSAQVDYWLVSQTTSQGDDENDLLSVHFNLLTSELLVNGVPLASLPSQYESHPTYRTLLGNSHLEVMPSTIKGMQYSGKKDYAGYALHFGITTSSSGSNNNDLLVQAVREDQRYELIPARIFRNHFPAAFANNHVHWYDIKNKSVEFRRTEDPWTSSRHNWKLTISRMGSKWQLNKDGDTLIGVASETAEVLSTVLAPLEAAEHIHIKFRDLSSSLSIELPRLHLGFNLKSRTSSIESRQFSGMMIDPDQALDTLIGFRNKLMLKHKNNGNRLILLPEGNVSCRKNGDHVQVDIQKTSATRAHAYQIDNQLGRLIDNGSLQSKLFLSYLHALTSFCLPDPLLQRTGTEQALLILRSAAVRSFSTLTPENVELLSRIAQLTPGRRYYPEDERVMQTVDWSPKLGFLAQHGGFYKCAKSIFDQVTIAKVFYPDTVLPQLNHVELELLERDCIRSSTFRISGFGAEDHTIDEDAEYSSRDGNQISEQGLHAIAMSSLIYQKRSALHLPVSIDLKDHLWTFLKQTVQILGFRHPLPSSDLRYDAGLLSASSEFIARHWLNLHHSLSQGSGIERFHLMIWLSTLAFAPNADLQIIQTMASFFALSAMAHISLPPSNSFRLQRGLYADGSELRSIVNSALLLLANSPQAKLTAEAKESPFNFKKRQQLAFEKERKAAVDRLVDALVGQWPCVSPTTPTDSNNPSFNAYIDVTKVMQAVKPLFMAWSDNNLFLEYLQRIDDALGRQTVSQIEMRPTPMASPEWIPRNKSSFVSVDDILACSTPSLLPAPKLDLPDLLSVIPATSTLNSAFSALVERLEVGASSEFAKDYVKSLRESGSSLKCREKTHCLRLNKADVEEFLADHLRRCKDQVHNLYQCIISNLKTLLSDEKCSKQRDIVSAIAVDVMQWPRLCPILLLQQLTRGRWPKLPHVWKRNIIAYSLALSSLQQAERLLALSSDHVELIKELENPGHVNWDPLEFPESLLLEIESGITIREVQEQIAGQMREPPSGKNAVMQLNMGEGKSSVIVPIVAAALADGSRLVRIIVAKPQSKQMFEMLASKLGGLLDRRIYHMPFSRALKLGEAEANTIGNIYRECMALGGVLLVQPEHILSFKLMGLECLISGKEAVGHSLLRTQHFFDTCSRDIVDESDENFSVKFELIYTMGMQRPVESSPDRWICIQQVLDLVKLFAARVKDEFPDSIDVHEAFSGSFPRTRILRPDAEQLMFSTIAEHICETGLNGFPIARQPQSTREAVLRYIIERNLTKDEINRVENQGSGGFWADATRSTLLLLRGLLAGGVLAFAFGQKRWKVNYGLDVTRTPTTKLAVPYRAKDNPTPRSEFSHPDVVIVLTSLSYYYGGLTNDDLYLAFGRLAKSDQADIEYQTWVKDAPKLGPSFHHLVGVNLKDQVQCEMQVFPCLQYSKGAIDYFLSHIVFPREMKEFPHKLSSSGWDIGQTKTHPTTGFSGTNDSRTVLPLSVRHVDLQEQKHTNALVLAYLLQVENTISLMPPRKKAFSSDADLLLTEVTKMSPRIQVILDVGAQILELSNLDVARQWLHMPQNNERQAVVFFNDRDELSVLDRNEVIEPLQTSSFAKRLNECLVFLDEAHTRGTDLKLPSKSRAAVTLGPNLTKDRLVQACMRMRKLGQGHSVVFLVPQEISNKIMAQTSRESPTSISVADVLFWAILETGIDIRRSMPLWAAQGKRYESQSSFWAEVRTKSGFRMSKSQAEKFLEDESRCLEARYRPSSGVNAASFISAGDNKNLGLIVQRCRGFNNLEFNSATLQEEQERELAPEIEQERQVQKPALASPATHTIHRDLRKFVSDGIPVLTSAGYKPAFEALRDSSAAAHLDVGQFPKDLLLTEDFHRTVKISGKDYKSDSFQRPVQWVLTSIAGGANREVTYMMIISPFEAQFLLPDINKSKFVALHLYSPRPNLSFRALDSLDLYTVPAQLQSRILPRRLVVQLNLFSGQLYLSSFQEYVELCKFLGLAWEKTEEGRFVAADGFIVHGGASSGVSNSAFTASPVKFLRVLLTKIRRNCEGIDKTHMGKILDGILLLPADFGDDEEVI